MAIIETKNLSFVYNAKTPQAKKALDAVNIAIEEGELVGVIGHTGSGKSTFIQHLNGLLKPQSGQVLIEDKDIWADKSKMRQVRFNVGLVFQYPEYQLFEETCYKDIAFGPKNMGLSPTEIDRCVKEACQAVGVSESLLNKSPFELSGGQKRRVAIAGVIAMKPKILILDEPTAGLDPRGREKILKRIKKYHQEEKNTVLLVSHSMEDIAAYATKILVMKDAQVHMYDTVQNVFSRSQELVHMGLDIPVITKIFHCLQEQGIAVDPNIYSVKQAKQEILKKIR